MSSRSRRSAVHRRVLTVSVLAVLAGLVAAVSVQAAGGARRLGTLQASPLPPNVPANGIEPANQPALDAAADDAQSVAGDAYYTASRVNAAANTVDIYLAGAPQSVIDQLEALHPGIYVIHNDAAHPLSQLLRIEHAGLLGRLQTATGSVTIVEAYPTPDGYLKVGVEGNGDVQAAQAALDTSAGAGIIKAYGGAQRPTLFGYRYNEGTPYNAGDFLHHVGVNRYDGSSNYPTNCSAGINVHKNGDPNTTYILTAAHCYFMYGADMNPGLYTSVHQGYIQPDDLPSIVPYSGNSNTLAGTVDRISDDSQGKTSNDVALIGASTGYDVFKGGWNSSTINAVASTISNHTGDVGVCTSGAPSGQLCGLTVGDLNVAISACVYTSFSNVEYDCYDATAIRLYSPSGSPAAGQGDSGGPVYSFDSNGNVRARGMIEGGDYAFPAACPSNGPSGWSGRTCNSKIYFIGMGAITGEFNLATNIKP